MREQAVLLLGGVGFSDLGDLSFGPIIVERLSRERLPDTVTVADLSYNPLAVVEWLRERPRQFDRAILIGAAQRGRAPGSLATVDWTAAPLSKEHVQERIAEAVTGTISVENLLIIAGHFGALPARTTVVELEPVDASWGEGLSAAGERRAREIVSWALDEARAGEASAGNGMAFQPRTAP